MKSCCVLQDHCDDEKDRVSQHNTRPVRPRPRPRPIFFWSETGLVLRPTVSDHVRRCCIEMRRSCCRCLCRHVGDLGNIVAENGIVKKTFTDRLVTLFGPKTVLNRTIVVSIGLCNTCLATCTSAGIQQKCLSFSRVFFFSACYP